jgi:hypothetical protein
MARCPTVRSKGRLNVVLFSAKQKGASLNNRVASRQAIQGVKNLRGRHSKDPARKVHASSPCEPSSSFIGGLETRMSIDCGTTGVRRGLANQTRRSCRPSTGRRLHGHIPYSATAIWEKVAIGQSTAIKSTCCNHKFTMLNTVHCVTCTTILCCMHRVCSSTTPTYAGARPGAYTSSARSSYMQARLPIDASMPPRSHLHVLRRLTRAPGPCMMRMRQVRTLLCWLDPSW